MFRIAQIVVRNKIAVLALAGIDAFFLMPNEDEPAAQSSNPWVKQAAPAAMASANKPGFVDTMVTCATDYLDEHDLNPLEQADESVNGFESNAAVLDTANNRLHHGFVG